MGRRGVMTPLSFLNQRINTVEMTIIATTVIMMTTIRGIPSLERTVKMAVGGAITMRGKRGGGISKGKKN